MFVIRLRSGRAFSKGTGHLHRHLQPRQMTGTGIAVPLSQHLALEEVVIRFQASALANLPLQLLVPNQPRKKSGPGARAHQGAPYIMLKPEIVCNPAN